MVGLLRRSDCREAPLPSVARIVEEQRGAYRVSGDFDGWAEVSGKFRHDARATAEFPAIGDWVCPTAPAAAERAVITRRLERRSTISRKAAGRVVEEQVVAANVDTIFLVTALADDLNPRRIERYLTVVRDAGAIPVVVLNKTDLASDPESQAAAMRARLPFVDVLGISAKRGEGLAELGAYLTAGQTIALIGSSGVGKSTLVNRLLGQDRLKTGRASARLTAGGATRRRPATWSSCPAVRCSSTRRACASCSRGWTNRRWPTPSRTSPSSR